MAGIFTPQVIIAIIGVIGTWIGVYLAYRAIKKDNNKIVNRIINFINSGNITLDQSNKKNIQVGAKNKNVQ